ncbi:hypothetical protein BASA81_014015 [Batrachochytrium salamandrivorans]|nr:hypothetical protein BASA81_014015 [Batrachochytrium salamandrivorans]
MASLEDFYQLLCTQEFHVIEDARLDAEKGMFLLEGAILFLSKQQQECQLTSRCPVCATKLLEPTQAENEDAVAIHEHCVQALNGAKSKQASSQRLEFYLRLGMLSEWRSQKAESLNAMHCKGCGRQFASAHDFARFLQRMDSNSSEMERELHIHPKFCPVALSTTAVGESPPLVKRPKLAPSSVREVQKVLKI